MATQPKASFDPKLFLAKVGDGRHLMKHRKGEAVFSQGEPADTVCYVQEGRVKLTVVSEQGKEAVVAVLGRQDFFGEGCLTGQRLRIATATAATDSVIVHIKKATITALIHEEPAFSELFIAHLLSRTVRVKQTSWINCSIRAKSVSRDCSCCWRTSEKKESPRPSSRKSARKRSLK